MADIPLVNILALLAGMRRIFLRDFSVSCSIGIHAQERTAHQRLLVNVDIYVERRPAADDIASVLDYDFLRLEILRIAESRHFELQETLAEEIAALCMQRGAVLAVRVSTEKPDVYPDCEAIGVEVMTMSDEFRRRVGHSVC